MLIPQLMSSDIFQHFLYLKFCDRRSSDIHLFSARKNFESRWLSCFTKYLSSEIQSKSLATYCYFFAIFLNIYLNNWAVSFKVKILNACIRLYINVMIIDGCFYNINFSYGNYNPTRFLTMF